MCVDTEVWEQTLLFQGVFQKTSQFLRLNRFIIVFTNSSTTYIAHVSRMLNNLHEYHLYDKAEKCEFHRSATTSMQMG